MSREIIECKDCEGYGYITHQVGINEYGEAELENQFCYTCEVSDKEKT